MTHPDQPDHDHRPAPDAGGEQQRSWGPSDSSEATQIVSPDHLRLSKPAAADPFSAPMPVIPVGPAAGPDRQPARYDPDGYNASQYNPDHYNPEHYNPEPLAVDQPRLGSAGEPGGGWAGFEASHPTDGATNTAVYPPAAPGQAAPGQAAPGQAAPGQMGPDQPQVPPGYAPAGYPAAYAPAILVPPPQYPAMVVVPASRVGPGFASAIIGLLLTAGGVFLAVKYGNAVAQRSFTGASPKVLDLVLAIVGILLLLAAVLFNGWSPWATLVPGIGLTGLGAWTFVSSSGSVTVSGWVRSVLNRDELNTWNVLGFTLILGLVMLAASAAAAMARASGKRAGTALGASRPPMR